MDLVVRAINAKYRELGEGGGGGGGRSLASWFGKMVQGRCDRSRRLTAQDSLTGLKITNTKTKVHIRLTRAFVVYFNTL